MKLIQFGIEFIQCIFQIFNFTAGFHLTGNATHIFSTIQYTVVDTSFNVTGLTACNAANIVAYMLIADRTVVDTGAYHTGVISCNAADICDGGNVFC